LSDYCTYRDEDSRDAVRAMGVRGNMGEVFPDLAFALPAPHARAERPGHVVIGVMGYAGGPQDRQRGADLVSTYVDRMSCLVTRLVDEARTVTLVLGDVADHELALEIDRRVRTLRPGLGQGQLRVSEAESLAAIMSEMTVAEVVVASRFHNLICALKLGKPTVSLGYAGKNARLLSDFGLGEFSQAIDSSTWTCSSTRSRR
jgi:polysaccharide pyruvyl transferase WcaK-like protein